LQELEKVQPEVGIVLYCTSDFIEGNILLIIDKAYYSKSLQGVLKDPAVSTYHTVLNNGISTTAPQIAAEMDMNTRFLEPLAYNEISDLLTWLYTVFNVQTMRSLLRSWKSKELIDIKWINLLKKEECYEVIQEVYNDNTIPTIDIWNSSNKFEEKVIFLNNNRIIDQDILTI